MEELTMEEKALELMSKNEDASVSWEEVTVALELYSDKLDEQIQRYEQLDIQAQNEALSFYVR